MLYDLTLELTPQLAQDDQGNEKKALVGHLGTHFDVMDKEFPLEYFCRPAVVFDVRGKEKIGIEDIQLELAKKGMFVAFFTGFLKEAGYGTEQYFKEHPQLSQALIRALVEKEISVIGIDCAGVRRGKEHTPADQFCADHNVFVVENLWGLEHLLDGEQQAAFTAYTAPMRYRGVTGIPCRVVGEKCGRNL